MKQHRSIKKSMDLLAEAYSSIHSEDVYNDNQEKGNVEDAEDSTNTIDNEAKITDKLQTREIIDFYLKLHDLTLRSDWEFQDILSFDEVDEVAASLYKAEQVLRKYLGDVDTYM
jgi:hypothetical protein